jgi:hypothetical protein
MLGLFLIIGAHEHFLSAGLELHSSGSLLHSSWYYRHEPAYPAFIFVFLSLACLTSHGINFHLFTRILPRLPNPLFLTFRISLAEEESRWPQVWLWAGSCTGSYSMTQEVWSHKQLQTTWQLIGYQNVTDSSQSGPATIFPYTHSALGLWCSFLCSIFKALSVIQAFPSIYTECIIASENLF